MTCDARSSPTPRALSPRARTSRPTSLRPRPTTAPAATPTRAGQPPATRGSMSGWTTWTAPSWPSWRCWRPGPPASGQHLCRPQRLRAPALHGARRAGGRARAPLRGQARHRPRALEPCCRPEPRGRGRAARRSSGVDGSGQDRLEQAPAGGGAEEGVDGVLGVGHEADDVAGRVADPGDVGQGAVGVVAGGVAEDDLAGGGKGGGVVVDVAAFAVLDRDGQGPAGGAGRGPGGGGGLDRDLDLAADEAEAG